MTPHAQENSYQLMLLLWLLTCSSTNLLADDLFIYPTKNQSAEKQDKDKWELSCVGHKPERFRPRGAT
jgi:hypothetical protein